MIDLKLEINSSLEIPYPLIDIRLGSTNFLLLFLGVDDNQSEYSIKRGGVMGKFGIKFRESGLKADFPVDATVGNIFAFYSDFKNVYESLCGTATLRDYSQERTLISVSFEKSGRCKIVASVKNMFTNANGTLNFELCCDQSYLHNTLKKFAVLFDELSDIQGYYDFPY